jgi:hypothetical protein
MSSSESAIGNIAQISSKQQAWRGEVKRKKCGAI